jgi:predicted nucleic acid-binding protein
MSADHFLESNIVVYAYDSSAGEKRSQALSLTWSEDFAAGRRYHRIKIRNPFPQ